MEEDNDSDDEYKKSHLVSISSLLLWVYSFRNISVGWANGWN